MNRIAIGIIIGICFATLLTLILFWNYMRKKYINLIDEVSLYIDQLISSDYINEEELEGFSLENETLSSKLQLKLKRLAEITISIKNNNQMQKEKIQEMVSDISHQLKTPIANITMYNDTILNHNLPKEKEVECLQVMQNQVTKLDFLVNSLMKMSRLENNIITLNKEQNNLYECLIEVVDAISLKAYNKNIEIKLICLDPYPLIYDAKWTAEAIFNVIDNAVKYTMFGGCIQIKVERFEVFTRIEVVDNGIGIAIEHVNDIFKRFYRESKVHKEEGVGIGLYLTREIFTKQGGYVKVESAQGKGSTFSLYLPNGL